MRLLTSHPPWFHPPLSRRYKAAMTSKTTKAASVHAAATLASGSADKLAELQAVLLKYGADSAAAMTALRKYKEAKAKTKTVTGAATMSTSSGSASA